MVGNLTRRRILVFAAVIALAKAQIVAAAPSKKAVAPMPDERFWSLVGRTTKFENQRDRQITALRAELRKLSVDEVEAFENVFDDLMKRSYSWDLWGAAYVIHGGASDDDFEYFRCWLISKGRATFERTLADPDGLADLLAPHLAGALEFEEFAYVARGVWGEKTGKDGGEMPNAAAMMYLDIKPSGSPFKEDAAYLAKRYPKLWRRFGDKPLG